ncbi:MAG: CdaR family protein [Clostridiales bacterium]
MINLNINNIIKKDIAFKIISVVIALFLWNYVLNLTNPLETYTYTIVIQEINKNSLDNKKLILKDKDYSRYISVKITGRVDKISKINQNDFNIVADFSQIDSYSDNKIKLKTDYIGNVDLNGIEIKYDQEYLDLDIESIKTNPYTVNIVTNGEPKQDYQIIKKVSDPESIGIESLGPLKDKISMVRTYVDVDDIDKDILVESKCRFYDNYGNEINDLNGIRTVKVYIEIAKEVEIEAFTTGIPEDGFQVGTKNVFPESVLLKGDSKVLQELETVKTERIDINGLSETKNFKSQVVLPEDVELANGNNQVNVSVEINDFSKRIIPIFKEDIKINNKNDKYNYEITSPSVLVEVVGDKKDIDNLDAEILKPSIDVKGFKNEDKYVELDLNLPSNVKTLDDYKVELSAKEK